MGEKENLVYTLNNEDYYEAIKKALGSVKSTYPTGTIPSAPIMSCCCTGTKKEPNIIKLKADYTEDKDFINKDPIGMDHIIKEELALRLARQMIDEDLIVIYRDSNIDYKTERFRAEVKIVQE